MPFSAFKDNAIGEKIGKLFVMTDYKERVAGYQALVKEAVEDGASIPLLQSVITLVRKKKLAYEKYGNGWVLANTMHWG
jgi:peptide/nickel transport system substrate-binding protein